jgi:hypothetical protein
MWPAHTGFIFLLAAFCGCRTNILNDELEKLDKLDFIELRVSGVKELRAVLIEYLYLSSPR